MGLAEIASTATTLVISNLIIGIIISVISLVLHIIFIIRVWTIVRYHYYKIKNEERAEKIKREYHELIQEEKQKTNKQQDAFKSDITLELKEHFKQKEELKPKEPDIIEKPEIVEEEPEIIEELKEPKTLKEKINRFLFRE